MCAALVAKLTEQRNFVLWWDTEAEKDPGNRFVAARSDVGEPSTDYVHLEDFGANHSEVTRWRSRLKDPLGPKKGVATPISGVRPRRRGAV